MLTQCCIAYSYPYVSTEEKALIRESFHIMLQQHEDYRSGLLSVPLPNAPCPGLAMGLATSICAVDPQLKASVYNHINTVCDFVEMLISELHLEQARVTNACEAFAIKNVSSDTSQMSLSTVGILFSMLIAFIDAGVPCDSLSLKKSPKRKHLVAFFTDVDQGCSAMLQQENKLVMRTWWKCARYLLACMAETLDAYQKSQDDVTEVRNAKSSTTGLLSGHIKYRNIYTLT